MAINNRFWSKLELLGMEGFTGGIPGDYDTPRDPPVPLAASEILSVEAHCGAALPDDYREFLAGIGGGGLMGTDEVSVYVRGIESRFGEDLFRVQILYGDSRKDKENNLLVVMKRFAKRMPDEVIPIGTNGMGDQFCLAVKGDKIGQVFYWDHEEEPDPTLKSGDARKDVLWRNLSLIASSFDDFLERLEPVAR